MLACFLTTSGQPVNFTLCLQAKIGGNLSNPDIEALIKAIQNKWTLKLSDKAKPYVGMFSNRIRIGTKIIGNVEGNYGNYTVSIQITPQLVITSACSCYIGKGGYCHHCAALAETFIKTPESFIEKTARKLDDVKALADITEFLENVTLENLISQLKAKGISQKDFAESIGMSTRHLSSVKSSELSNRFYHELGATKLACLWILEHCSKK